LTGLVTWYFYELETMPIQRITVHWHTALAPHHSWIDTLTWVSDYLRKATSSYGVGARYRLLSLCLGA